MNKQTAVHPDNGILFSVRKQWATKPWKDMEETKPIWRGYILADSNYMISWKRCVYMSLKPWGEWKDQWLLGLGIWEEGWIGRVPRSFRAVKIFCMINHDDKCIALRSLYVCLNS